MNVKIIIIGHTKKLLDLNKLRDHKSKFIKIDSIEHINCITTPNQKSNYLNLVYSKEEVVEMLGDVNSSGIVVGIMNYHYDDNFYMHRVGENKICISIADIYHMLLVNEISVENFIINNIYSAFVCKAIFNNLHTDDIYNLFHADTRGCLFDLNGDKYDIVYNTEKPIICDECKSSINKRTIPVNFIEDIEKELGKIKKSKLKSIEIFIRKYPLVSVGLTFLSSTLINLFSNFIWKLLTGT